MFVFLSSRSKRAVYSVSKHSSLAHTVVASAFGLDSAVIASIVIINTAEYLFSPASFPCGFQRTISYTKTPSSVSHYLFNIISIPLCLHLYHSIYCVMVTKLLAYSSRPMGAPGRLHLRSRSNLAL